MASEAKPLSPKEQIYLWVASHGGWTKVGGVAIFAAGMAYGTVPSFHDACARVWSALPTFVKDAIVTISALYSWFRNPTTKKILDGMLGPGDTLNVKNPAIETDGTLSGSSATLTKAPSPDASK